MPLSEQTLGGFKTGMTRSSRRGGKDGAQKLWTLQNGYVNDQGDVVPRPGLQHVANVEGSAGLYGADGQLHVFYGDTDLFVDPGNPLVTGHLLRYPLDLGGADDPLYLPADNQTKYLLVPTEDTFDYSAPGYDDSAWLTSLGPYGTTDYPEAADYGFRTHPITGWTQSLYLWNRFHLRLGRTMDVLFKLYADDGADIYVNGIKVASLVVPSPSPPYYLTATIPASAFVSGDNVVAIKGVGDVFGNNCFLDYRLVKA